MPLISVLALVCWTLAAIRLLAARATFSARTFGAYLLLGALIGIICAPLVQRLAAPYGEQGLYINELNSLGCQAVLLLPAIWLLFFRGAHEVTSLADAFLLAFVIGFGFDVAGALLVSSVAPAPLKGLSFWPPWQFNGEEFSVAGYGYWSGLVALLIAAALRFVRNRYLAVSLGVLTFLLVATERAALLSPPQAKPENWLARFGNLSSNGTLTAWIALAALVVFSIMEASWAARKAGDDSQIKFQLLAELQALLNALARGNLREFLRLCAVFRLRRQLVLARAEASRSPENEELWRIQGQLEGKLQRLELGAGENAEALSIGWFRKFGWWGRALAVTMLAGVVLLPNSVGAFFWSFPLLHFPIAGLPTILCGAFIAVIFWRYLAAAGRPIAAGEPDDLAQFLGEKSLVWMSLLAALLVFFYSRVETFYPFPSVVASYTHAKFPEFEVAQKNTVPHRIQLATMLLLLSVVAGGTSVRRAALWQRVALDTRRRTALRNAVSAAGLIALCWLSLAIHRPALEWCHRSLGVYFFRLQQGLKLKEIFGAGGNTVGALATALLMCLLFAGLALLHRSQSARLERFLIGDATDPAGRPTAAGAREASVGARV